MCMHMWHMCVSMMLSIELTAGWDWRGHFHYYTIALIKRFLGIRWSLWAVWILNILSFVLVKRANITEYLPRRRVNCIVQSEIKIFEALIKNMYICIIALDLKKGDVLPWLVGLLWRCKCVHFNWRTNYWKIYWRCWMHISSLYVWSPTAMLLYI